MMLGVKVIYALGLILMLMFIMLGDDIIHATRQCSGYDSVGMCQEEK
jgi:hypothetical protein